MLNIAFPSKVFPSGCIFCFFHLPAHFPSLPPTHPFPYVFMFLATLLPRSRVTSYSPRLMASRIVLINLTSLIMFEAVGHFLLLGILFSCRLELPPPAFLTSSPPSLPPLPNPCPPTILKMLTSSQFSVFGLCPFSGLLQGVEDAVGGPFHIAFSSCSGRKTPPLCPGMNHDWSKK